jgi:hypothetical protein
MSTWVWVLTFTVLGVEAQHHTFSKYASKAECEQALQSMKQQKAQQKQQIAGSCKLVAK